MQPIPRRVRLSAASLVVLGAVAGCGGTTPTVTVVPRTVAGVPSSHVTLGPTGVTTPAPSATATAIVVHTRPPHTSVPVTEGPTSIVTPTPTEAYHPPTVSLSVSPALIYETYPGGPSLCTAFSTTYATLTAVIDAPGGVKSAVAYFSFTGNSGSGALSLNNGSSTTWSTAIGGYIYTNYTGGSAIVGTETISYYVVVTDKKNASTKSITVTNQVRECSPRSHP